MSGDVGAEVAAVLAAHDGYEWWPITREFICTCEASIGRDYPDRAHRAHLADALAPLIAEHARAAMAEAWAVAECCQAGWDAEFQQAVMLRAKVARIEKLLDQTDAEATEHQHLARLSTHQIRSALDPGPRP